jgi:hypothetical protein
LPDTELFFAIRRFGRVQSGITLQQRWKALQRVGRSMRQCHVIFLPMSGLPSGQAAEATLDLLGHGLSLSVNFFLKISET